MSRPTNSQMETANVVGAAWRWVLTDSECNTLSKTIAHALASEAERATLAEREACAQVCEEDADQFTRTGYPVQRRVRERAAAIRARKEADRG